MHRYLVIAVLVMGTPCLQAADGPPTPARVYLPALTDEASSEGQCVSSKVSAIDVEVTVLHDDGGWYTVVEGIRFPLNVHFSERHGWSVDVLSYVPGMPTKGTAYHLAWSNNAAALCVYEVPSLSGEPRRRHPFTILAGR